MKPRVLIADANRSLCDVYQRFLSGFGCPVKTVSGGLDCVAMLPVFRPDVLLLDLQLPWGGADGVLAWLCETPGLQAVPAVILIGDAVPSMATEIILTFSVVKAYHQKPIFPSELLEAVDDLAQYRWGQEPVRGWEGPNQTAFRLQPDHVAEELGRTPRWEIECVELPLLMPRWQFAALSRVADRFGLTPAQLLRQLLGIYLAGLADSRVPNENHLKTN